MCQARSKLSKSSIKSYTSMSDILVSWQNCQDSKGFGHPHPSNSTACITHTLPLVMVPLCASFTWGTSESLTITNTLISLIPMATCVLLCHVHQHTLRSNFCNLQPATNWWAPVAFWNYGKKLQELFNPTFFKQTQTIPYGQHYKVLLPNQNDVWLPWRTVSSLYVYWSWKNIFLCY